MRKKLVVLESQPDTTPRANLRRRASSKQAASLPYLELIQILTEPTNQVPIYVASSPMQEQKMFLWPEAFSEYKSRTITKAVAA
jgi:hypothetical protein